MSDARHHRGAFGDDRFGQAAEAGARFFGTPQYIIGQSLIVLAWIGLNAWGAIAKWDPFPFILLNLAFSTQAAYAAPLILLAQTRQADRDKHQASVEAKHREELATEQTALLKANTDLTEQVHALTVKIDAALAPKAKPGARKAPAKK